MRSAVASCLAVSLALQPVMAAAGQSAVTPARPATPPVQTPTPPQLPPDQTLPSVEALGVSFDRIKRELRESAPSTNATPLRLDFHIEVMALAPPMQLFTPAELAAGPVPGAPPTHWDMVDLWTKPEFKAPVVPVSSLAIMGIAKLIQWQAEQARKRRAEEDRQRELEELRRKYPDIVVK